MLEGLETFFGGPAKPTSYHIALLFLLYLYVVNKYKSKMKIRVWYIILLIVLVRCAPDNVFSPSHHTFRSDLMVEGYDIEKV